jgi:methionine-S-sulfoxide reductase
MIRRAAQIAVFAVAVLSGGVALGAEEVATFAGGCFWCMEEAFEKIDGVREVVSGYTGGTVEDPTYREVTTGTTGHTEAVQIYYDETRITYEELLEVFWRNVDPLDAGGQFCDRGSQYRTGIFYHDEGQRELAVASKQELEDSDRFGREIVTEIMELDEFYEAEEYHQDYYKKNPGRYGLYKSACGRVRRLEQLWGAEAGGDV